MPAIQYILLGAVPGLLWLAYVWRKDRWEREPLLLLLRVFALGLAAAYVIAQLRPRLEVWLLPAEPGLAEDLADAFLVTAGGEEFLKMLAFALGALWHAEWDEPMDGIVYGAAAGLGFASLENAYFLSAGGDGGLLLARAFTANLAHVVFSGGLGFAFGLAKLRGSWVPIPVGVIAVLVMHGVYDLFLFSHPEWSRLALLGVLPLGLAGLALATRWSQRHSPHSPHAPECGGEGRPSRAARS